MNVATSFCLLDTLSFLPKVCVLMIVADRPEAVKIILEGVRIKSVPLEQLHNDL